MSEIFDRAGGRELLQFRFGFEQVRPTADEVETVLGYDAGRCPPPVREAIGNVLASSGRIWSIEGGCVLHDPVAVATAARRLSIAGVTFEVGAILSAQLSRAEAIAVFLCTAGPGIEELSRRRMAAGDQLGGYVADTVGSLVVERAVDAMQDQLEAQQRARGLRITNRYSPGHCGWNVTEQQKLFRLLPYGFCGVSLTESSLMRPLKSVSGVIGIGGTVCRSPYTCELCEMDECLYRRRRAAAV